MSLHFHHFWREQDHPTPSFPILNSTREPSTTSGPLDTQTHRMFTLQINFQESQPKIAICTGCAINPSLKVNHDEAPALCTWTHSSKQRALSPVTSRRHISPLLQGPQHGAHAWHAMYTLCSTVGHWDGTVRANHTEDNCCGSYSLVWYCTPVTSTFGSLEDQELEANLVYLLNSRAT